MLLLPAQAITPNTLHHTNALSLLNALSDSSIDAIIADPPYAEVDRDYGRLSEQIWFDLMTSCVMEFKRVLKPTGSAVIVLQPNYEIVGKMRAWVWRFMVWCCEFWNIVQDAYWWNHAAIPLAGASHGLMRQSVKYLIWLGSPNCYRNQDDVLWTASQSTLAMNAANRSRTYFPSGVSKNEGAILDTVMRRGGVTPFNLLPIANTNSANSGGAKGHGAATPYPLCEWWVKYISRPGDVVLDTFCGSGTTLIAARNLGRRYIGCDTSAKYINVAKDGLKLPFEARIVKPENNVDDLPLFKTGS